MRFELLVFRSATGLGPLVLDAASEEAAKEEAQRSGYLRQVPEDPVAQSSQAWVVVAPPKGEQGAVFDIRSAAAGAGRNGKAFAEW